MDLATGIGYVSTDAFGETGDLGGTAGVDEVGLAGALAKNFCPLLLHRLLQYR